MTRVVHLELHTANMARACAFYTRACGWEAGQVRVAERPYMALEWGGDTSGGVVECGTERSLWLPYVEVADVNRATGLAIELGARVMLEPRDGPTGRRSVVSVPDGAEVAFWQSRR